MTVLYVAIGLSAAMLTYVVFQLATKGLTGSRFGAHVLSKSNKIIQDGDWLTSGHLRVYALKAGGRNLVGIEASGLLLETTLIRLTPETARTLARAIEDATDQS
jgi:hypothetical protein